MDDNIIAGVNDLADMLAQTCELACPLYVVNATSLTGSLSPSAGTAYAATQADLDLTVRDFVDWRGRGIAVVVSLPAIMAEEVDLLGILVHELAHAIRGDFLGHISLRESIDPVDVTGRLVACYRLFTRTERNEVDDIYATRLSRIDHDALWGRIALEIRHRLVWRFGLLMAVAGIAAPTTTAHQCHCLLLETKEYDVCANMSLQEIIHRPLPEGFQEAWNQGF
jgi:hypothetical protein